ncbi:MAG: DUF3365 domain-containing protein [SAR324 cluster bacterium]|nr:DUF3365 domain-containing protein [SAR324 cluster bacterium]
MWIVILKMLREHTVLALGILLALGIIVITTSLYFLQNQVSEAMATQYASQFADSIGKIRSYYSQNVVGKVRNHGVTITHDYINQEMAIPFPATLSIELGNELSKSLNGTVVRLYSNFPFPWRSSGGSRDSYEKAALAFLENEKEKPFIRLEEYENRWSLRYTKAVVMGPSCIACHNTHPQTPKNDWKVGDVRGGQEIIIPLDLVKNTFNQGLLNILIIMLSITGLSLAILALVLKELKNTNIILQKTNAAFRRFVPENFLNYLNKPSIIDVNLGDHIQQEMTILFSDMRSFTSISENMTPEENFKFLNSYLQQMDPVIQKHNGFIDKYIGDAIMALFGGNADDALEAAVSMLQKLDDYNHGRESAGYPPVNIRIGINSGALMLGTIGGEDRMEGTVISDAVNLASRIESLSKIYGTTILIGENTYQKLKDPKKFTLRWIDKVQVKGKQEKVAIWEVIDGESPEIRDQKKKSVQLFGEAIALYQESNFREAEKLFQEVLQLCPQDTVAQIYISRCRSR